jgi:hypothetical protein
MQLHFAEMQLQFSHGNAIAFPKNNAILHFNEMHLHFRGRNANAFHTHPTFATATAGSAGAPQLRRGRSLRSLALSAEPLAPKGDPRQGGDPPTIPS